MGTKELNSIISAIPVEYLKGIKATNAQPSSERTVRFDVPTESKDVVRRVKVTAMPEGFTVKLYAVTQTDQIDMISAAGLTRAIEAMLTGKLPDVDLSKYGKAE